MLPPGILLKVLSDLILTCCLFSRYFPVPLTSGVWILVRAASHVISSELRRTAECLSRWTLRLPIDKLIKSDLVHHIRNRIVVVLH